MPEADPAALARLLDLQSEDTAIRRLTDQRASLFEAAQLAELSEQIAELEADLEIAAKQSDELGREQARVEGEMSLTGQKIEREEGRLFSGGVASPKELSNLQAEVESLKRRRAEQEDALLEVMVQKDDVTETVGRLDAEHREATTEAQELSTTVTRLTGDIDSELARRHTDRTAIAGALPGDLLELYEQLREQKGGVGAAALETDTCSGCHTKLPAREVQRLRAEKGLQRCDNCRRILVVL